MFFTFIHSALLLGGNSTIASFCVLQAQKSYNNSLSSNIYPIYFFQGWVGSIFEQTRSLQTKFYTFRSPLYHTDNKKKGIRAQTNRVLLLDMPNNDSGCRPQAKDCVKMHSLYW